MYHSTLDKRVIKKKFGSWGMGLRIESFGIRVFGFVPVPGKELGWRVDHLVSGLGVRVQGFGFESEGSETPPPMYRGTSLTRKRTPLGAYRRPMPRVLGGPRGVGVFLWARYPCGVSGL